MDWLLSKLPGMDKLADALTTFHAKIVGLAASLSGAGMILTGAAGLLTEVASCAQLSCVVGVWRGIAADPNAALILKGVGVAYAGLVALGIAHKASSDAAGMAAPAPAGPPPQVPDPKP